MKELINLFLRPLAIYANGMSGIKPKIPIDPEKLKNLALRKLNKNKRSYLESNAGIGQSFQANMKAFQRYQLIPSVGQDITSLKTEKEFLGFSLPAPIMICPIGGLGIYHKGAEAEVARAANTLSIPMILSTLSTVPLEKIAGTLKKSPKLMQLYLTNSKEINQSIINRATEAGFNALVLTMDTKTMGWRPSDLDLAYTPFTIDGIGLGQFYSDPEFQKLIMEKQQELPSNIKNPKLNYHLIRSIFRIAKNHPDGLLKSLLSGKVVNTIKKMDKIKFDASLNWEHVQNMVEGSKLPVFVKGILNPEDARQALDRGAKGIIVSNHGGRQCDGLVAALDMLPEVAKVVEKKASLLFDSGIRTGSDIVKALALGADAVCIGRPIAYGLILQGEAGVQSVLENIISEFLITLALCGVSDIHKINMDILRRLQ